MGSTDDRNDYWKRSMADAAMTTETRELWETIAAYLEAESLELDDLDVVGGGGGRIVRVTVDAPDGVGVDRIADTSRALSRLLDERDPIDGSYTLEVTSPGLERPLRRRSHYEKSMGRTVTVKTNRELDGVRRHDGELSAVDSEGIMVSAEGGDRRIEFDEIASARTVFEWKRNPKPGKKSG